MSINIRTDFMQHAELFGNPVLFTNWLIQRDTIPKDWYGFTPGQQCVPPVGRGNDTGTVL